MSEPRLLTPRSSDRSIRPVTALPSIPDTTLRAALYRASGFVLWHERDERSFELQVCLSALMRKAARAHNLARFACRDLGSSRVKPDVARPVDLERRNVGWAKRSVPTSTVPLNRTLFTWARRFAP
jgi:hypothetical protein